LITHRMAQSQPQMVHNQPEPNVRFEPPTRPFYERWTHRKVNDVHPFTSFHRRSQRHISFPTARGNRLRFLAIVVAISSAIAFTQWLKKPLPITVTNKDIILAELEDREKYWKRGGSPMRGRNIGDPVKIPQVYLETVYPNSILPTYEQDFPDHIEAEAKKIVEQLKLEDYEASVQELAKKIEK